MFIPRIAMIALNLVCAISLAWDPHDAMYSRPVERLYPDEYTLVRQIVMNAFRGYQPHEHYFLGLGRSMTAVVRFMQNLNPDLAGNVPLSKGEGLDRELVSGKCSETVLAHFARFFPSQEVLGDRNLVIMDFVIDGEAFIGGKEMLERCLSQLVIRKRYSRTPALFGFVLVNNIGSQNWHDHIFPAVRSSVKTFPVGGIPAYFYKGYHKNFSEYGTYQLGSSQLLNRRPEYDRFGVFLQAQMNEDPTLAESLSREFPALEIPCSPLLLLSAALTP
jgi:hypothetical protein